MLFLTGTAAGAVGPAGVNGMAGYKFDRVIIPVNN